MISAAIVNFNEERKLEKCLKSIQDFVDEIVILDLDSKDNSKKIAERFGAKFSSHSFVPYVESIRNTLVDKANGDWILVLDPDEELSVSLKSKLSEIAKKNKVDVVEIPRKNIFFGKWIAHTNWWPDYHVRFFKKGKVKWSSRIHKYPEISGKVLKLPADEKFAIIHYGYDSATEFLIRQNRYSSIEAENLYNLGQRFSWTLFFWKPFREILVRFIKHLGFLDGFYGFYLTLLMMIYQMQVMVKLWEIQREKQ